MTLWTDAHSSALLAAPVLTVNFHHIAAENRSEVAKRLRRASLLGPSWQPADLEAGGSRPQSARPEGAAPTIFVAFYDGYHDTGLFGAEVCHGLGLRACFFPVFASSDPARGQLSDEDLAQIATVHELGFHTASHLTAAQIHAGNVADEVVAPVERIQRVAGRPPVLGAWRGGTRFDEETLGDRTVRALGLRGLVSNWSLERIPPPPAE